jgi:alpha-glucuronidase
MMMTSREAVVNYMTPLGLAHIMANKPSLWSGRVGAAAACRPDAVLLSSR